MRVHPAPRKRNYAHDRIAAGRFKKLRRLPHVFTSVIELPIGSEADVSVEEESGGFRFRFSAAAACGGADVHAVEVHPGVVKVVVGPSDEGMEVDRWTARLPPSTRPAGATAAFVGGELVVFVPKGGVAM